MERPIPYNGTEPFIFISYSHKDSSIVWPILSHMIDDGYRVWYDDGINPGTEWDEFIATKITTCGYFLAFVSQNYMNSDNCKDELNYARDQVDNKLLVYLEDVSLPKGMEMRLGRIQAIAAFGIRKEADFYKKLYSSKDINLFRETRVVAPVIDNTVPAPNVDPVFDAEPQLANDGGTIVMDNIVMDTVGNIPTLIDDVDNDNGEEKATKKVKPTKVKPAKEADSASGAGFMDKLKSMDKTKLIILIAAAVVCIVCLGVFAYFLDDFIFFVGKYNGMGKAVSSLCIAMVSIIVIAVAGIFVKKKVL